MFTKWKSEAFDEFNQKLIEQKQLEAENKLLHQQQHDKSEELKKLSKDIFLIEENWNELMTLQVKYRKQTLKIVILFKSDVYSILQNYYYILQDSEWRQLNDWIHIDSNGDILSPLQAINNCKTRNIRIRIDCSGFSIKDHFDNETSQHLEKMKSISPEPDLLKTVCAFNIVSAFFNKLKSKISSRIWRC